MSEAGCVGCIADRSHSSVVILSERRRKKLQLMWLCATALEQLTLIMPAQRQGLVTTQASWNPKPHLFAYRLTTSVPANLSCKPRFLLSKATMRKPMQKSIALGMVAKYLPSARA